MPPWVQTGLLLLMMAHYYVVVCLPPPLSPCAPNIAMNNNNNIAPNKQCLHQHYLQETHKETLCSDGLSPERRRQEMEKFRLRYCCDHRVSEALPEAAFKDSTNCRFHLQELIEIDDLAFEASCSQADLLLRYDCAQNYSIAFNCDQCKVAYRRWVCSELVPFYRKGVQHRVPPCLHFCQNVEQQCPYLLPDQTLTASEAAHPTPQYAGEPNFFCLDPNIPRLEERSNSTTGDEDCCYTHCGAPGRGPKDQFYVCEKCSINNRHLNGTRVSTTTDESRHRSTIEEPTSGTRNTINFVSRWMLWTFILMTLIPRFYDLLLLLSINLLIGTINSVRTVPVC